MSRHRRHKSQKKKLRTGAKVAIVLLSVIAAVGIAVFILYSNTLGKVTYVKRDAVERIPITQEVFVVDDADAINTVEPEDVDFGVKKEALIAEAIEDPEIINILLIGQDRREGNERLNSDTMVICSINKRTNKITLISLMRDLYVPITGYSDNRLNASFFAGGMALLDETIEKNFGIHIDGNFEVDFDRFVTAMSKVGTLEIELKDYEVQYMKKQNANWNLQIGKNYLSADQLLCYARIRRVGNGEFERTERQRTVLIKAFNKLFSSDVRTLISAATDILPSLTTDMSPVDIINLIYIMKANNVKMGDTYRIPVEGTYSLEMIRGMAVIVPDLAANRAALKEYIYGES